MRVAVVGLGLIGGSVGRRLAPAHDVIGWDADARVRDHAALMGLSVAGSVEEAAAGADVAIVATPLGVMAPVLTSLSTTDCRTVTDVGSVKRPVLAAAAAAGLAERFVGGHPMAGTEQAGFGASDPALLDGAAWVLCLDPDTDLEAWLRVAALVAGTGCRAVPSGSAAHDETMARVSGLPHLLACALSVAAAEGGPLAGALAAGSVRDGTRVAGSRPDLIAALCDNNRTALAPVLDETIALLGDAREALAAGRSVMPLALAGHTGRHAWSEPKPTVAGVLDPTGTGFRDDLLDLGAAGGFVDAVLPDGRLHAQRPADPDPLPADREV